MDSQNDVLKFAIFGMEDDLAYQYNFQIAEETEGSVDDEDNDKTYKPSQLEIKIAMETEAEDIELFSKSKAKGSKRKVTRKKDQEFEIKEKVATEVAKYRNLFEVSDPKYADKQLESATWKKVSEVVGVDVDTTIKHWNSHKRSARYYARESKIPSKSGAAADEMDWRRIYKEDWQFGEVMSFYTPPALKPSEPLVSILNPIPSTSKSGTDVDSDILENATTASVFTESTDLESVYVSDINLLNILMSVFIMIFNFRTAPRNRKSSKLKIR